MLSAHKSIVHFQFYEIAMVSQPMKTILVIHGVGPFDEAEIKKSLSSAADDVLAINWDNRFPPIRPIDDRKFGDGIRAILELFNRLGRATNVAATMGFFASEYCAMPRLLLRLQNALATIFTIISLSLLAIYPLAWIVLHMLIADSRDIPRGIDLLNSWAMWSLYLAASLAGMIALVGVSARNKGAIWASFRRLLVSLWPLLPASYVLSMFVVTWYIGIKPITELSSYVEHVHHQLTGQYTTPLWLNAVKIGIQGLGTIACIVAMIPLWFAIFFATKTFADVILYCGESRYRENLQRFALESLDPVPSDSDFVLLTHSLGTVIAADILIAKPDLFKRFRAVHWITMGSPIDRLFARLFPEIFPTSEQISRYLDRAIPNLAWTNIYRRLDFIGARLQFSERAHRIQRVCPTLSDPITSHTGYWKDKLVHSILIGGRNHADDFVELLRAWPTHLTEGEPKGFVRTLWLRRRLLCEAVAAFLALAIVGLAQWADRYDPLGAGGLHIVATVVLYLSFSRALVAIFGAAPIAPLYEESNSSKTSGLSFPRIPRWAWASIPAIAVVAAAILLFGWSLGVPA
ncbi:MAG: hypothetical protein U1F15_15405 [Burkholderiales bacterium]